jgi:hypothetical protein
VWLSRWLHRRCERERAADRAQHDAWARESRRQWGAKNKAISEAANERIALAAAEARQRIAAARSAIDAEVRQRTEHALRTAAMRAAAERRAEREAAFTEGVAVGRAEALRDGPPVVATGELARLLTATPRDEACTKIRLNDREHAEAMVAHVLETSGVRTEPYRCPVCPRQMFDRGLFWHVRTIDDPAERAKRDAMKNGKSKGRPDRLALRLDPEQIRLMNERARGSVDDSGVAQFGSAAGS